MREWAGDRKKQEKIVRQIVKRYSNVHPVDMAGVAETILVNMVNNVAPNLEAALAGIDAVAGDMKTAIRETRGH